MRLFCMHERPGRRSARGGLWVIFALVGAHAAARAAQVEIVQEGNRAVVTRAGEPGRAERLSLTFDARGNGFVTAASLGETTACSATKASGLFVSLILPADGEGPLAPLRGRQIDAAIAAKSVTGRKAAGKADVTIKGTATFAGLGAAPFTVHVEVPQSGPAMSISAELLLPDAAGKAHLSSFGIAVPLELAFHPTSQMKTKVDRKTAAAAILPRAGTPVPEVRWLVARQDDTSVWGPMLWTLAGIRQRTATSCEVWEAWSKVNPPFVLQYHTAHPGWMAVADGRVAVAAGVPGIEKAAPTEIYVDSEARLLRICFQSPYCRPVDPGSAHVLRQAGPVYLFLEPSPPGTRNAEEYRDPKKRPALARITEALAKLDAAKRSGSPRAPKPAADPAEHEAPPLVPADPEFSSHEPGRPDEIAVWVDEPHGALLEAWPITRGIPLRRGALKNQEKAALFDAAGKAVPCVSRALAWWPDRSVKWLLLDFQARLEAGVGAKYKLVVGDKAKAVAVPRPLKVTQSPGEVAVDTGKLRLAAANRAGGLALTVGLDVNGDGKVADDETIVKQTGGILGCVFSHLKDPAGYPSGTWLDVGEADPGLAEIKELRLEEQSALRAVVLVRADLKHKLLASTIPQEHRPECGTPVTLRFHLYAGSSMVRLQHTFLFAGDVNHDFLRQLGVRLPVRGPQVVRTSLTGVGMGAAFGRGAGVEMGLLQEGPDSALLWRTVRGKAAVMSSRHRSVGDGWLDVTGKRWGVTVGLRNMRETFPKEIHVDDEGVWAHFWPPHVPPMDVRRYAFKYGDGESTSTGWGTAFGAIRTHEACWYFHPADEEEAQAPVQVRAMLDPPLARVRPRHVADTLAVGHVAEHGAATNDGHFDAVLYHLPRMHQHNGLFWRWLGFWDFGDEVQVYNEARRRWDKDEGRYGWYNNEPLRDYNYHLAFLMTGHRRIWRQAEAMSYHVFEVDLRHASPQPFMSAGAKLEQQRYDHSTTNGADFCGRRHNCQHWADGYWGRRVGSPPGFRLCYYQTADPVMREDLHRLLAAAMTTRRSEYMHADSDEALLWAMIMGHEMTLEQKYLDRIRGYVDLQVAFAKKHDGIPAGQANWDWATNTAGAPAADPRGDLWIWSFGGHVAMIEVADVFGDADVDAFLRNWTLALEGFGPDRKRRESWSNNIGACPLLAYYYRRTGDRRALDWLQQRAKRFHSYIPKDAPREDLPVRVMESVLPAYTPNDGYGWVYTTPTFWYVGIPAWQGALRARAQP